VGRTTAVRKHMMTIREDFPFSHQVRPSAAATGRRAGPVLAPLRAADPAAAHKHEQTKAQRRREILRRVAANTFSFVRTASGLTILAGGAWTSVAPSRCGASTLLLSHLGFFVVNFVTVVRP
jgi:hypothetical protein